MTSPKPISMEIIWHGQYQDVQEEKDALHDTPWKIAISLVSIVSTSNTTPSTLHIQFGRSLGNIFLMFNMSLLTFLAMKSISNVGRA